MGNGVGKLSVCFTGAVNPDEARRRRKDMPMMISDPLDDLGHSFCYVRPELTRLSSSKVHTEYEEASTTTFRSISGAAVSANTSTPLSIAFVDHYSYNSIDRASPFESSTSFGVNPPWFRCDGGISPSQFWGVGSLPIANYTLKYLQLKSQCFHFFLQIENDCSSIKHRCINRLPFIQLDM
ncbi:putative protein phosphatase 2C 23 [Abeliophyllum distichum]|uniref:Uncharacterized protein n=1 Tax=Abeliophyllum distichum TaxID=126358 RepID=A0ABD1PV67_9LAMI